MKECGYLFFKYIVELNTWADKVNSPYTLRAIRDDGADYGQALVTDIVDYIGLFARKEDDLVRCIADFYDAEQAVLFFKNMISS